MENKTNNTRLEKIPKTVRWLIGMNVVAWILGFGYLGYNQLKLPSNTIQEKTYKILKYASQHDGKAGISVGDFDDLSKKFYETDPRHEFAKHYVGGRMQPYPGNPAIKMRGITSWNDSEDKKLTFRQRYNLEEVLFQTKPEELDRVIEAYHSKSIKK